MRIGLDFGTTNSGAAIFDGGQVRVLPLDPFSHDPTVIRSTMYITRDHQVFIGREAIETYYRQNVGRPSKMVRQYVGEIEVTAADMSFIRDVYVLVDELTPGRLLRSLKSGLATGYEGTTVFDHFYELEDLIALYLRQIRERVEAETGQPVEGVVLGRPVNFAGSSSPADNARAVERLRRAAERAGFPEVAFELEPVAAALHYELMVSEPQNAIVFDFGGGTLDITVMRLGEPGHREVFATGGVGIAGDVFDQRVIQALLLDHFGRGSTVRLSPSTRLRTGTHDEASSEGDAPFPSQYTDALVNWQTIPELNRPETLHFLQLAQIDGSHPARVRALESLLVNNYAVRLFDEVEGAKIALSEAHFALVRLAEEEIDIWQPLTRSQFESLIAAETQRIEACLLETLASSGLLAGEVDAVIRTGGSAQIPCFIEMLGRVFDPEKVVLSAVFSGVTAGLAIRAAMDQDINSSPPPPERSFLDAG
ncbi:MAG: Hsp70 family protein [Anaerolineae bacterium]|nr:MAG: Hsp70 family protein [Anaerolineae bacterium]